MAKQSENTTGRRKFLWTASMAGAALGSQHATAAPSIVQGNGPATWVIDDTSAVGETESGKVLGYMRNDVRIFKGIPYAEILSPEGRWRRGAKTRPWTGKRESRAAGFVCPPGR